jgi:hypothetical protein
MYPYMAVKYMIRVTRSCCARRYSYFCNHLWLWYTHSHTHKHRQTLSLSHTHTHARARTHIHFLSRYVFL